MASIIIKASFFGGHPVNSCFFYYLISEGEASHHFTDMLPFLALVICSNNEKIPLGKIVFPSGFVHTFDRLSEDILYYVMPQNIPFWAKNLRLKLRWAFFFHCLKKAKLMQRKWSKIQTTLNVGKSS